jgi:hypothetical protein
MTQMQERLIGGYNLPLAGAGEVPAQVVAEMAKVDVAVVAEEGVITKEAMLGKSSVSMGKEFRYTHPTVLRRHSGITFQNQSGSNLCR